MKHFVYIHEAFLGLLDNIMLLSKAWRERERERERERGREREREREGGLS